MRPFVSQGNRPLIHKQLQLQRDLTQRVCTCQCQARILLAHSITIIYDIYLMTKSCPFPKQLRLMPQITHQNGITGDGSIDVNVTFF